MPTIIYLRGLAEFVSALLIGSRTKRRYGYSTGRSSSTQILRQLTVVPPFATPVPRPAAGFQSQRARLPKVEGARCGERLN